LPSESISRNGPSMTSGPFGRVRIVTSGMGTPPYSAARPPDRATKRLIYPIERRQTSPRRLTIGRFASQHEKG
jgi:hypothetical protein